MQPQPETPSSSADQGQDRLISKSQAAALLGVSTRTVDRICSEGSLDKVFLRGSVRFRLRDIQAIVQSGI